MKVWLLWCNEDDYLVSIHSSKERAEKALDEVVENLVGDMDTEFVDWRSDYRIDEWTID